MAITRPRQTSGFEYDRTLGQTTPLVVKKLCTANTAYAKGDLVYMDQATGKLVKWTATANARAAYIMAQDVATTDNVAAAEWYAEVYDGPDNIFRVSIGTGATKFVDAQGNATATTTTFTTTKDTLVEASTDILGSLIYFYDGPGKGEKRTVSTYAIAGGIATITFLKALSASPTTATYMVCGAVGGKDGTWAPGVIGIAAGHHQYVDFSVLPQEGRTPIELVDIDWKNLIAEVKLTAPYMPQVILGDNKKLGFGDLATTLGGDLAMRWDGTDFDILPAVDDTVIKIGDGTLSCDFWLYGNAAADNVILDASANIVNLDGIDLQLEDSDFLYFGDAKDVSMKWDATNLVILPVADDTGSFNIGDGTTDMDVKMFLGTSSKYLLCDVGNSRVDCTEQFRFSDEIVHTAAAKTANKTTPYTTLGIDSGQIIYVATSSAMTLITATASLFGVTYTFVNAGSDGQYGVLIAPAAGDHIRGGGLAAHPDAYRIMNTKATSKKGDMVTLNCNASGWNILAMNGTWATKNLASP